MQTINEIQKESSSINCLRLYCTYEAMKTPIICSSSFPASFSQKIILYTYLFAQHCGSFIKRVLSFPRGIKKRCYMLQQLSLKAERFAQCIECLHGMREWNLNLMIFNSKVFFFPRYHISWLVFMEIILLCNKDRKEPSFSLIQDHTSTVKDLPYGSFQPMKAWPASFTSSLSQLVQIIPVHHNCNIPWSSPEVQKEGFNHFTDCCWCSGTAELLRRTSAGSDVSLA